MFGIMMIGFACYVLIVTVIWTDDPILKYTHVANLAVFVFCVIITQIYDRCMSEDDVTNEDDELDQDIKV